MIRWMTPRYGCAWWQSRWVDDRYNTHKAKDERTLQMGALLEVVQFCTGAQLLRFKLMLLATRLWAYPGQSSMTAARAFIKIVGYLTDSLGQTTEDVETFVGTDVQWWAKTEPGRWTRKHNGRRWRSEAVSVSTRLQTKSMDLQKATRTTEWALDKPRFVPRRLCSRPMKDAQGLLAQWMHRFAQTMILPERVLQEGEEQEWNTWKSWTKWPLVCLCRELRMMEWTRSQIKGACQRAWLRRPVNGRGESTLRLANAYDFKKEWLTKALDEADAWLTGRG